MPRTTARKSRRHSPAGQPAAVLFLDSRFRSDYVLTGSALDDIGPACRRCGCTEFSACPGGCVWVEPDLCSRCA